MNPLWEALLTLRRSLGPSHQNNADNNMENARRTNNDQDAFREYSRHSDEPQSSTGENVASRGVPPSHKVCIKGSEVQDGQPLEVDKEDPELARKRKELQDIEERILFKKAAIALKTVESDLSCNVQSNIHNGLTLKDRVNVILQQRHPASFLSKVQSPRERKNSYSMSKDGVPQDEHPLKRRVKVLMERRSRDHLSPESEEVPDATPSPPSQSVTSPAKEENGVDKGFQRFLSVLNKGVDMDFLSRIVNDEDVAIPSGEELLNTEPCVPENNSSTPVRIERKRSNSGASLPGCTRSTSRERNTDLLIQETSLNERLSSPDDDKKQKHRGDRRSGSGSRSKSPLAVKKKKKEEEKPKVDQQHEQLQNILKTLGLSLEVEEMSKLADRTQERLYGKKHEDRIADSKGGQETPQKDSQKHRSESSSSSSSRSASRICSRSPSRHRRSRSRDSTQKSEQRGSRDRNRDGLRRQDRDLNKEAKRYGDEDEEQHKETSDYQHPYPQHQMYPHTAPAAYSAYPDYSLPQVSGYSAHSDMYSNSYWTQATHHPSLYHSGFPYPQNTYHHFTEVTPNMAYPQHSFVNANSFMNPDPYMTHGQSGSGSDPGSWQFSNEHNPGQVQQMQAQNSQNWALKVVSCSSKIKKGNEVPYRPNLVAVKCEKIKKYALSGALKKGNKVPDRSNLVTVTPKAKKPKKKCAPSAGIKKGNVVQKKKKKTPKAKKPVGECVPLGK